MKTDKTLFLTGATGTLGKSLIREWLTTGDVRLFLLIRRTQRESHWDRARKILAGCGLEFYLGTRVHVMQGDITRPDFGLSPEDLEILRKETDIFHHVAALTNLNGSEEECTQVNLEGTREAIRLARFLRDQGRLERFFYCSTAYVPGSLQKLHSMEDALPEKPAHANFYESTKYAAEKEVRQAMEEGLPTTIFRPSIVVGHSETGEVSEFNVIYPFMRLFAHGMLEKLPCRLENAFNIVPIDFVVKAISAISDQEDSLGKTYHLVTRQPPTIGMLMDLKEKEYSQLPPVQVISPESFNPDELELNERFAFDMLQPYLGYLNESLTFDTTHTEEALQGTGIDFPVTDQNFLRTLLRYAVDQGYLVVN